MKLLFSRPGVLDTYSAGLTGQVSWLITVNNQTEQSPIQPWKEVELRHVN